jgi:hypothetical protein
MRQCMHGSAVSGSAGLTVEATEHVDEVVNQRRILYSLVLILGFAPSCRAQAGISGNKFDVVAAPNRNKSSLAIPITGSNT